MKNNHVTAQRVRDVIIVSFTHASLVSSETVREAHGELDRLVRRLEAKKVLLDLGQVRQMSSSALGMIISLQNSLKGEKGEVVLCNLQPELRELAKIFSLDKLFAVKRALSEGLNHFGLSLGAKLERVAEE